MVIITVVSYAFKGVARERKNSDNLLLNILLYETARDLKENGVARARAHKDVSIVFADVQNFTKIASGLEPTILVKVLDQYFSMFDAIIKEFGLEKIKTIRDAYMFVSGLENSNNSALSAVEATLKILEDAASKQQYMLGEHGVKFKFRVGMHTGNIVSGVVGNVKYAFDIWGDAVNTASRMETNSIPGKINVSDKT